MYRPDFAPGIPDSADSDELESSEIRSDPFASDHHHSLKRRSRTRCLSSSSSSTTKRAKYTDATPSDEPQTLRGQGRGLRWLDGEVLERLSVRLTIFFILFLVMFAYGLDTTLVSLSRRAVVPINGRRGLGTVGLRYFVFKPTFSYRIYSNQAP